VEAGAPERRSPYRIAIENGDAVASEAQELRAQVADGSTSDNGAADVRARLKEILHSTDALQGDGDRLTERGALEIRSGRQRVHETGWDRQVLGVGAVAAHHADLATLGAGDEIPLPTAVARHAALNALDNYRLPS